MPFSGPAPCSEWKPGWARHSDPKIKAWRGCCGETALKEGRTCMRVMCGQNWLHKIFRAQYKLNVGLGFTLIKDGMTMRAEH